MPLLAPGSWRTRFSRFTAGTFAEICAEAETSAAICTAQDMVNTALLTLTMFKVSDNMHD